MGIGTKTKSKLQRHFDALPGRPPRHLLEFGHLGGGGNHATNIGLDMHHARRGLCGME
jgi:hypothetical protein